MRIHALTAVVVTTALVAVATASAATPKAGGKYEGVLFKGSVDPATGLYNLDPRGWEKPFILTVAASGKTAQILWWCGHVRKIDQRSQAKFPLKPDGTFSYRKGTGSYTAWAIKGRFVTATVARVAFRVPSICDGKGGTVTLKLTT